MNMGPMVHILMATHQGERFIEEQLASIKAQTHTRWSLIVSDDGSQDSTLEKIHQFAAQCKNTHPVQVMAGPEAGFVYNFVHLIQSLDLTQLRGDLFAFADQDDVWMPDKLERAVAFHLAHGSVGHLGMSQPLLYASTAEICAADLKPLGLSRAPRQPLRFKAALVENVISGHTMVANAALMDIYQKIQPGHWVWHDWTACLIALGCGGGVHVDERPSVFYRQHGQNAIGVKTGWVNGLRRLQAVGQGRYHTWLGLNVLGLHDIWDDLDVQSQEATRELERLLAATNPIERLRVARRAGFERQGWRGQLAFWGLCALGWV
jgi:glycosyltransferase involved in cell wall biosynthesis